MDPQINDKLGLRRGSMINSSFVCLFNRSVRADTHMGPEGTKRRRRRSLDDRLMKFLW